MKAERRAERITGNKVKEIANVARQYITNATLLGVADYDAAFAAQELQAAIETLTRLHARVLADAMIEKASSN